MEFKAKGKLMQVSLSNMAWFLDANNPFCYHLSTGFPSRDDFIVSNKIISSSVTLFAGVCYVSSSFSEISMLPNSEISRGGSSASCSTPPLATNGLTLGCLSLWHNFFLTLCACHQGEGDVGKLPQVASVSRSGSSRIK